MGLYRKFVFPRLMNAAMAAQERYRSAGLAGVSGSVLEIGIGSGLNLPHYPKNLHKLTAIDANPGMEPLARRQIERVGVDVDLNFGPAEQLPFPDTTFDSVVSTWTMCSVSNAPQVLQEIYRVLKPGGQFFFIEHGLSSDARIQKWQDRITPIAKSFLDGCHLNRDIQGLVRAVDWKVQKLESFYGEEIPQIFGYLSQGVAQK